MAYDLTSMKILHSSGNRPYIRRLFAVYLKLQGFTISCFFVVNCSMAVDANHCSVVYTEEYCQLYSNVPYECPNMCKVCPCKCLTAALLMRVVGVKSLVDADKHFGIVTHQFHRIWSVSDGQTLRSKAFNCYAKMLSENWFPTILNTIYLHKCYMHAKKHSKFKLFLLHI